MLHQNPRRSRKLRLNRTATLEKLEDRLPFAVDALSESVALLLDSEPFAPTVEARAVPKTKAAAKNKPPAIAKAPNVSKAITTSKTKLSVLGKDDGGESKLTYNWQVLSAPRNGSVSFSANNTNAAKNTVLTFGKAGQYRVNLTVTDKGGLKKTVSYRLRVVATLSSIELTPSESTAEIGSSVKFKAQGLDQFGNPIRSRITWKVPTGKISSSGVWTGSTKAGKFVIQASSGKISSRINFSVTNKPPAPDPATTSGVNGLVQTYFADGSISRPDMINILRSTGADGSVNTAELNDLKNLVNNAAKYKMPDYVKVLASDVVFGNRANTVTLKAGSSAAQLNSLIDKWFYGTDRPTLTSSSLSYRVSSGTLFNGNPSYMDEHQGALGDCYFVSTLGIIASKTPDAIRNMFIDNLDGTYTVRFFTGVYGAFMNSDNSISDGFKSGVGTADYVTVDKQFASTSSGKFAYSNAGASISSTTTSLWLALAEKAYAQWNATGKSGRSTVANSYASIEGGWMSVVSAQVLGYNASNFSLSSFDKQKLIDLLNAGNAITIGTKATGQTSTLVGAHAYSVIGYDANTDQFQLHNPWGTQHPGGMSYSQLQAECTYFVVADATKFQVSSVSRLVSQVRSEQDAASAVVIVSTPQTWDTNRMNLHFEELSNSVDTITIQETDLVAQDTMDFDNEHIGDAFQAESPEQLLDSIDSLFAELAENDMLFSA